MKCEEEKEETEEKKVNAEKVEKKSQGRGILYRLTMERKSQNCGDV